tara:strand:- start:165 stop:497 length:333 start_codon:yes stop_codon:yes gene_type:complete
MPPSAATPLYLLSNMTQIQNYLKNPVIAAIATIISVATLHYAFVMLYTYLCVPSGIFGAFWNIISLGSPFCYALNTIQFRLSENYITIWTGVVMALVGWFVGKIGINKST